LILQALKTGKIYKAVCGLLVALFVLNMSSGIGFTASSSPDSDMSISMSKEKHDHHASHYKSQVHIDNCGMAVCSVAIIPAISLVMQVQIVTHKFFDVTNPLASRAALPTAPPPRSLT
jgi:hypothetical protein